MEGTEDVVLIDIRSTDMTLPEVLARVEEFRAMPEYEGCEIFLDGDRYAIVARPKRAVRRDPEGASEG